MKRPTPAQFIQQTRAEIAKIVWPTRRETITTTIMVLIMAAIAALFFSVVDMGIGFGLRQILGLAG
ncbi:preprotein translocase subunit SecE [Paracoccaceae bacterium GXU_MW_L88]